jgi:hypothetical protein
MPDVDKAYDISGLILAIGALVVFLATAAVWYTGRERDRQSAERIANANAEAARLRLDLERERAKAAPRALSEAQFNALQELKGQVAEVNVTYEWDNLEAGQFAGQIRTALERAGVKAVMTPAEQNFHWAGNRFAVHLPPDQAKNSPLVKAFTKAGLGGEAGEGLFALFPNSHERQRIDVPIVAIGEKPIEYITKPYYPEK